MDKRQSKNNELKGYLCGVIDSINDASSLERIFYFTKGLQDNQSEIRIPEQEETDRNLRKAIIQFLYGVDSEYLEKIYYYVKAKYVRSLAVNEKGAK